MAKKMTQFKLSGVKRTQTSLPNAWKADDGYNYYRTDGLYVNGNKTAAQVFAQSQRIQRLARELQDRYSHQASAAETRGQLSENYFRAGDRGDLAFNTTAALGNLERKDNNSTISSIVRNHNKTLSKLAAQNEQWAFTNPSNAKYHLLASRNYRNQKIASRGGSNS